MNIVFLFCLFSLTVSGLDSLTFLKEFCLHPQEVGAIAATSSYTGNELCYFLSSQERGDKGLRILEIGGGFGNVSEIISGYMKDNDVLDIVEINPEFCEKIKKRVGNKNNISVQCCSILDWNPVEKYDCIISTLPFNAFSYIFFEDVFNHICSLGTTDVVFSYVEYLGLGKVRDVFTFNKDVQMIKKFLHKQHRDKKVRVETVWLNLPPLQVYHLKINE